MKYILVVILLVLVAVNTWGQYTQNLRGVVTDSESGTSIPGANVLISNAHNEFGTISNENGEFVFANLPIGQWNLAVSFMGYESNQIRNIQIISGKEVFVPVSLVEKVIKVDEVVVKAYAKGDPHNAMTTLSARSFTVNETEKYAGSLGDPSRMASAFAGVITANDSRNDIIIRGNSPQGLLWMIDGIAIPNPNHFGALGSTGGPVSILNNNQLANSDFFTGAFPAQYGNALSGVFDLKLRNGNNTKHEFVGQIGFNGFEFGAEGPFSKKSKASYIINYRYSVLDVMSKLGFDVAGGAVPEYQDLSFKINLPTKNAGTFSLFGIAGDSNIEFEASDDEGSSSYDTGNNTFTQNGSKLGIIGLTHRIFIPGNASFYTTVSGTHQQVATLVDSVFTNQPNKAFFGEKNKEQRLGINTRFNKKFDASNTLNAGFGFQSISINYIDSVNGEVYDPPLYGQFIYSLKTDQKNMPLWQSFAEWQHRFNNSLTLYAGLHYQYFHFNRTSSIDPRANLSYRLSNNSKINLGYGHHSQIQPLYVYFVEDFDQDKQTYIQTNHDLAFSKAHHFIAGYDHMLTANLKLRLETYYQQLYDTPVSAETGWYSIVNSGNSFNQERIANLTNSGSGHNKGAEITLEKYLDQNYYFLVTASLFDSKYKGSDNVLRNTEFNTNHILNALAGYRFVLNENSFLECNLRSIWSGGKRNIPIDLERSKAEGSTVYDHSKAYEQKEKDYFRMDIRISFIQNKKKYTQEWALDISNLSNHKNVYNSYYSTKKDAIEHVYQQMMYPMFLYRINF